MQELLKNTQFIQMIGTLFYCAVSWLVIWFIVKIYGVTGNPLLRALDNISVIKKILSKLIEKLETNQPLNLEEIAATLKRLEKYNDKLIKNLSAFQYDHSNIIEIGTSKGEIMKIRKSCLNIIENLTDGDDSNNREILIIIQGIDQMMDTAEANIKLIQKRQARRQMIH
ncbi:MAG: hypothetical protein WC162_00425 [Sphaerochaetaceae bacterium]